ncbi:MAG: tripartite tricarboxylate transporter substrate binding protein [Acetobacteraceae bacterium]|nr:tripartite tricarboxylate transporter substrate binding protein [Acetobacteraceae bacterium]
MRSTRRASLAALLAAPAAVRAQASWPDRPVRIIVPFAPGGPTDIVARALAERLFEAWRQPVVVENRPGAGGTIGTDLVARAAPDGTTLLIAASAHVMNPPVMARLPFDPIRDFTPVINLAFHPMVLAVHPAVPVRSVPEFIAAARARPGGLTMVSSGVGTSSHLVTALFAQSVGIELTHVPFNGAAPAQAAILGGQVQAGFLNATIAVAPIQSGALRGLAVTAERRWRDLPEVPTMPELGHAGVLAGSWYGVLAPAGLPAGLRDRIHADMAAALAQPALRTRIMAAGLDPIEVGPEAFAAQLAAELATWTRVVREAGIRAE